MEELDVGQASKASRDVEIRSARSSDGDVKVVDDQLRHYDDVVSSSSSSSISDIV